MNKVLRMCMLLGCWPMALSADGAFQCGNRIVSLGDAKAEVLLRCGAPAWREDWKEYDIEVLSPDRERRHTLAREIWLYDPGPTAFQRLLTFENGHLIAIATGGRGGISAAAPGQACDFDGLSEGLTQYEALLRCGPPFFSDSRQDEVVLSHGDKRRRVMGKRLDEWTYNLGPNRFMRILIFANGRLQAVRSGARGQ